MPVPFSHARPVLCLLALGALGLTGCSHQNPAVFPVLPANQTVTADRIPAAARLATRGTGKQSFRAPHDGRAWIFDDDRKVILYSALLHTGELITITPSLHRVSVNGEAHDVSGIYDRNLHAIYFAALPETN